MDIILIHGMGRTPLSMLILRQRLRAAGYKPQLFGYSPTLESFEPCVRRFAAYVQKTVGDRPYALAGHSLGTVLIRGALPMLADNPPRACFFLAPPSLACRAARFFADNPLYKLLMGEMGQLLADQAFMDALPPPPANTWIYAGTKGLPGAFSPFGGEPNDGILTVAEAEGTLGLPTIPTPATHTFIMNSRAVADGIIHILDWLTSMVNSGHAD